jgi:hypothetical protein
MGINECYPERKIFQTEPKDTWIFGLYNTCSYNSARGKQVFGVCCTNGFPQMVNGQGNEVEQQTEADSESIQRKCTPMPTGSQCTYTGTRIVNGQEAARNSYPFMVIITIYYQRATRFECENTKNWCHLFVLADLLRRFPLISKKKFKKNTSTPVRSLPEKIWVVYHRWFGRI